MAIQQVSQYDTDCFHVTYNFYCWEEADSLNWKDMTRKISFQRQCHNTKTSGAENVFDISFIAQKGLKLLPLTCAIY